MDKSTTKRFFLHHTKIPENLEKGNRYILDQSEPEILFQLTKVFRLSTVQKIILINILSDSLSSSGNTEYHFQVAQLSKKSIDLELLEKKSIKSSLSHSLSLALCLPNKPAKLDFVLEKATEIGVSKFYLFKSDYSQFNHELKPDRLQKIVTEAAEQSEQPTPPRIFILKNVDEYLSLISTGGLVALERDSADHHSILSTPLSGDTTILIGPEGGFSNREVELFARSNQELINLGGNILKMDTAAILAVGILSLRLQG